MHPCDMTKRAGGTNGNTDLPVNVIKNDLLSCDLSDNTKKIFNQNLLQPF